MRIAYVIGPYVKQDALVSAHYTTVSMLHTIEDILGIEPMGINEGLAEPMAEGFDQEQSDWSNEAIVPEILYTTELPLPERTTAYRTLTGRRIAGATASRHDSECWARLMRAQNFKSEDEPDEPRFNRALWTGLRGRAFPIRCYGMAEICDITDRSSC